MNRLRKLTLICGTVGLAVGAGHLVEQREAAALRAPTEVQPVSAGPQDVAPTSIRAAGFIATESREQVAPATPAPVAIAALPDLAETAAAAPPATAAPVNAALPPQALPDCTASLQLIPTAGGALSVWLKAPCAPGARVELRQDGLALAYRTLPSGNLFVTLPALSDKAMVAARLPDGSTVIATAEVSDLAGQRRVGVAWGSTDAFQLIAAPGAMPVMLGDPDVDSPMVGAIVTLARGAVMPDFEAAVTQATCGRTMAGKVIVQDGPAATVSDLTLSMPACDAVGDILVLNNLLPDVTLAAR